MVQTILLFIAITFSLIVLFCMALGSILLVWKLIWEMNKEGMFGDVFDKEANTVGFNPVKK